MRSNRQVNMIKLVYIEIHRKDDYCLREPMQFNCEFGEVLVALCRVAQLVGLSMNLGNPQKLSMSA